MKVHRLGTKAMYKVDDEEHDYPTSKSSNTSTIFDIYMLGKRESEEKSKPIVSILFKQGNDIPAEIFPREAMRLKALLEELASKDPAEYTII